MQFHQTDQKSLHKRINEYLCSEPVTYEIGETDQATIEVMCDRLRRAEEDLKTAQERVDRLVWELDKAKL